MNILKRPSVLKRVGVSKATLATMISNGEFPKPIKLNSRAVGWIDTEIDGWLDAKIAARDGVK
jgi:prophage regulatory protein